MPMCFRTRYEALLRNANLEAPLPACTHFSYFVRTRTQPAKHNGMSLRVKQTDSHWALAPVLDECRAIGKPGLSPNG